MKDSLKAAVWEEGALAEAVAELARAGKIPALKQRGIAAGGVASAPLPLGEATPWLMAVAEQIGVRALEVDCSYAELESSLARLAPAIVRLTHDGEPAYLAVLRSDRRRATLLSPRLSRLTVGIDELHEALTSLLDQLPLRRIDGWLGAARIGGRRARRARRKLVELLFAERRVGGMWLLRPDPGSDFGAQLRASGVLREGGLAVGLSFGQVTTALVGWVLLGRSSLQGAIEPTWVVAWALMGLSGLPLQLGSVWLGGRSLQSVAARLKQRLLCGALRLPPDQIRRRGSGRLLSMVAESEALENAGLGGAFGAVLALVQLVSAACVLGLGAGGLLHVALLLGWSLVVTWLVLRLVRARGAWTEERLALSCSFVENVVGNRTRVAQQTRGRWHQLEDRQVQSQLAAASRFDQAQTNLAILPARGWLALGFVGLIPALLAQKTPAQLAVAMGGLLLAHAAFGSLASALGQLAAARVAWEKVSELFHAAELLPLPGHPSLAHASASGGSPCPPGPGTAVEPASAGTPLLDVRGLWHRHRAGAEPVLRDLELSLRAGDRLLIDGPSGGGKSTLASLLVGLRSPESGHILLGGLDRTTLGTSAWLRRIASAPQFHENHIFSASLAFNLLMGREWPPSPNDRKQAEDVCQELGLGPLLSRMPGGMNQIIGETGWQLSHGERSRIFLGRALLQQSNLVVLDESFGALDPETARACLRAVSRRSRAVIVIAHP